MADEFQRYTRRRLGQAGAASGVLATGILSVACGGSPQGAAEKVETTKAPVSIRAFIGGLDGPSADRWGSDIADPFRQRHPNVTLEFVSQAAEIGGIKTSGTLGVVEKLVAQIAGGDPPDINDLPRTATWQVEAGFLDDKMDGFVKRDKYDTKVFNQKEFNYRAVHQGKIFQIPFKIGGNSLVLVCNRDLFRAEGVAIPGTEASRTWDWNGFVDTLSRVTKRTGGVGSQVTQFGLMNYAWHLGSWPLLWETDWVTADGKTVTCDSADMQDCYTKFNDLFHRHHVIPKPGEAQALVGSANMFTAGKAAMTFMSSGSWQTYVTRGELTDIAFAPMPKVKISTPDVNTHSLGIIKGSKHQAEAWEAIKFLNDGSRLARLSNRLPAILKDVEPWAKKDLERFPNADVKVVFRALETHVPQTNLGAHKYQDDMLRVLNPAMDNMLAGTEAPVPLLKRVKPELQAIAARS